jgi:hypothetical protein
MNDDAAAPACDHTRQRKARELVNAEDVGRKDQFERLARHVFGSAGHAVPTVVEQCVERSAGQLHGLRPPRLDACRISVIDPHAVEPLGAPRLDILGFPARRDHAPVPVAQRPRGREADPRGTPGNEYAASHWPTLFGPDKTRLIRGLKEIFGHVA